MKGRLVLVLVLCSSLFLVPVPGQAVNVPGCGEFLVFARDKIAFENGPTRLTGDFFAQSPTGEVKVGAKNILHGTVTAHKIYLGTGVVVDHCVADLITGPGTCTTSTLGFTPPAACTASFPPLPLVTPAIPGCVKTAASVTVPAGASQSLVSGCYGNVRLNAGATLTLTPGGTYNFEDLRLLLDATLITSPGTSATVNVLGGLATEAGTTFQNLLMYVMSDSGNAAHVWNGGVLEDTTIVVPSGGLHTHTGVQLRGTAELVAGQLVVQVATNIPPPPPLVCECPVGTHFRDNASRDCVPD